MNSSAAENGTAAVPRFSVVITSFRSLRFLEECLGSVLKSTGPTFELLFLENGSPEPEADWVEANIHDPRLQVFRLSETRYFAGGLNYLAARARGEFLVWLNSDAKVEPDWLQVLDDALRKTGFEAMQADLRDLGDPGKHETRGYHIDRLGLVVHYREGEAAPSEPIFAAGGAAFAMRRDVFIELGALDESFRMYFEDTDVCWRANLFGYRIGRAPGSIVYHLGHGSARKAFFPVNHFRNTRNRMLSFTKNAGPWLLAFFLPANLLTRFVSVLALTLTGKFGKAIAETASVGSYFLLLPRALSERRRIQSLRKVGDRELLDRGLILSSFKYFLPPVKQGHGEA